MALPHRTDEMHTKANYECVPNKGAVVTGHTRGQSEEQREGVRKLKQQEPEPLLGAVWTLEGVLACGFLRGLCQAGTEGKPGLSQTLAGLRSLLPRIRLCWS